MKGILLAAGVGSRLRPLTDVLPKCLMPINGRPLLEYWLSDLHGAGVGPVLLNLHHRATIVRQWLSAQDLPVKVQTFFEEKLLNTGGTLLANREFVGNDSVILIHADNLCAADLNKFINAHHQRPPGTEITMMTFTTPSPETCGIVELDSQGVVQGFHEKVSNPPGRLANAALYILEPEVLDFLRTLNKPVIDFSIEVLPRYLGKISTYHNAIYHRDIGRFDHYLKAQHDYPRKALPSRSMDEWYNPLPQEETLSERFLMALALAANASVVNLDSLNSHDFREHFRGSDGQTIIFNVMFMEINPETLGQRLNECCPEYLPQILIYLPLSRANFSAKDFYEHFKIVCIPFCQSSLN